MAELVDVNAQVKAEPEVSSPEDQHEENIVKNVERLFRQSQGATKNIRSEWPENYKFVVQGQQWNIRRPKWRFSESLNILWANIMTEVGIQTDGRPKVDFRASEPSDFQFAEVLKDINDTNWNKPLNTGFGWSRKLQTAIFKSKLYHVVHAEIKWDTKMEDGLGDVKFDILDPYGCYWDPVASNIFDSRYFIYARPRPTEELKKKYPDKAKKIKPDVADMGRPSTDGIDDHDLDRFFTTTGPSNTLESEKVDRQEGRFGGEEMTMLTRVWLKDDAVIEIERDMDEVDEQGNPKKEFVLKKKYPKGRYLEIANNMILKEEGENGESDPKDPNIYEDGLFPICPLVNYDYGEYAGENEVTHQRGPQRLVNYTLSHIMDQFKMGSNPQKLVNERSAKVMKKLTNEPGLTLSVPDVNDVRWESGPGIAAGSFNLVDVLMGAFDKVGGLQDSTRGAPQPGVTSGLMLEGFVEAAQTRPRLKNRSVDDFLTQMGHLCASRYLEFYTANRVFRMTSKEGFPKFIEFFITDEGGERVADVSTTVLDPEQGPIQSQEQLSAKGIPDVMPVSGSNLPFAKAQKTATALDLHGRGAITLESMLDAINWPNAQEEAKKAQEEQQAALASQQPAQ